MGSLWGKECVQDDSATVIVPVFEWVKCFDVINRTMQQSWRGESVQSHVITQADNVPEPGWYKSDTYSIELIPACFVSLILLRSFYIFLLCSFYYWWPGAKEVVKAGVVKHWNRSWRYNFDNIPAVSGKYTAKNNISLNWDSPYHMLLQQQTHQRHKKDSLSHLRCKTVFHVSPDSLAGQPVWYSMAQPPVSSPGCHPR